MLREGILTSEPVNSVSWPAEVFYRRAMSIVDDFGRYYAKPELLRAACYPLQLDKVGNPDIAKWLAETRKAGLVRTYTVEGKDYLEIVNFKQQVRAKHGSKYPAPPSDATQLLSSCDTDAPVVVVVDVNAVVDEGVRQPAPTKRKSRSEIPKDFAVSDRVKSWSAEKGFDRLDQHLESFISKVRKNDYRYVDWDEAFMEAVRENWAKLPAASKPFAPIKRLCEEEISPGNVCGMPGEQDGGRIRCAHHSRLRREASGRPMPEFAKKALSDFKAGKGAE